MDQSGIESGNRDAFNRSAEPFLRTVGQLRNYDHCYRYFVSKLPSGGRIVEFGCGPGNTARDIIALKPDLDYLGVDYADGMIELARATVPRARFKAGDSRTFMLPSASLDGVVLAFIIPFLDKKEVTALLARCSAFLKPGGLLYVSFMVGRNDGWESVSFAPDSRIHFTYHSEADIRIALESAGLSVEAGWNQPYLEKDGTTITDIILVARKDS